MSDTPKLHYFNISYGRSEAIRLAFIYGNLPFEYNTFSFPEWPAIKPTAPWGTAPWLDVKQGQIGQTQAILRYVGKQTGLYPKDDFEAAKVDELLCALEDVTGVLRPIFQEQDPAKKKELQEATLKGDLKNSLERYERNLQQSQSNFAVGSSPSITDLSIFVIRRAHMLSWVPTSFWDNFKRFNQITEAVAQLPALQAELSKQQQQQQQQS
eukprot:TRINITY_DN4322_c0_g1_i2.p1 TRINITY_DN4322_c0_g1~~TRINITY_DN4322_c0_g1_i2.p1  ORF type:complete len:211 (+),score=45.32 TRINITY_DN4322_c0_g1_i2:46-678(+)